MPTIKTVAADAIQYAGQVIIDTIKLYTSDRKTSLDISFLFTEIDIFEDIFSPSLFGSILLVEGFDLSSSFPILGEEILELEFHTPTFTTSIKKLFAVTAITDKTLNDNKKQVYLLNFVSIEAIVDLNTKVYRAYSGTPSSSASQVFSSYFPTSTLYVEDSANSLKIVAPKVSPFTLINMFASKAIDKSNFGAPTFLFYEDNQAHNFVSLTSLYKQGPLTTLKWAQGLLREKPVEGEPNRDKTPDGRSVRDINEDYMNAKSIEITTLLNTIDRTMSGAFGHQVIAVDPMRKSYSKLTYSYTDDFNSVTHLNPYPTNSTNLVHSDLALTETCTLSPAAHDQFQQDRDGYILTKRPSLLAQTEFIKLNLVIHGRTDMKVGQVINFEMGKFQTSDESDQSKSSKLDPYYSGNYLITAIQHRLTLTRHEAIIQLVKESFNSQIDFARKIA